MIKTSEALFTGNVKELSIKDIEVGLKGVPSFEIEEGTALIDVIVNNGIASSRREAREFLNAGSISLNGDKVSDENMPVTKDLAIEEQIIVVKRGKKKNYIVKFK